MTYGALSHQRHQQLVAEISSREPHSLDRKTLNQFDLIVADLENQARQRGKVARVRTLVRLQAAVEHQLAFDCFREVASERDAGRMPHRAAGSNDEGDLSSARGGETLKQFCRYGQGYPNEFDDDYFVTALAALCISKRYKIAKFLSPLGCLTRNAQAPIGHFSGEACQSGYSSK